MLRLHQPTSAAWNVTTKNSLIPGRLGAGGILCLAYQRLGVQRADERRCADTRPEPDRRKHAGFVNTAAPRRRQETKKALATEVARAARLHWGRSHTPASRRWIVKQCPERAYLASLQSWVTSGMSSYQSQNQSAVKCQGSMTSTHAGQRADPPSKFRKKRLNSCRNQRGSSHRKIRRLLHTCPPLKEEKQSKQNARESNLLCSILVGTLSFDKNNSFTCEDGRRGFVSPARIRLMASSQRARRTGSSLAE
jgi:hypothetical protein